MSNYVNTTIETREAEVNYIVEIHKDMRDNCKHWYTNSYDFSNGDRVKITVEITKNWATAVTVAESEEDMTVYNFCEKMNVPYKLLLEKWAKRLDAEEMTIHRDGSVTLMCKDGYICERYIPTSTEICK